MVLLHLSGPAPSKWKTRTARLFATSSLKEKTSWLARNSAMGKEPLQRIRLRLIIMTAARNHSSLKRRINDSCHKIYWENSKNYLPMTTLRSPRSMIILSMDNVKSPIVMKSSARKLIAILLRSALIIWMSWGKSLFISNQSISWPAATEVWPHKSHERLQIQP